MVRRITLTGLVLFCFIQAQYRDIPDVVTKVATATANWLKIETGVRAIGMGGAYTAVGDDVSDSRSSRIVLR